ncbi:MAG: pilus assembly protein [Eubacterium sp.]|jgi:hypothetical protein|nr:pilus assembly protein [Eubacterium sp.]
MKEKLLKIRKTLTNENGAVMIVEASFVFPIMFFVLFFLIYFGNMYVVKSAISRFTSTCAIKGAEYYSNPWVKEVTQNYLGNDVPTKNDDVKPYRHIFSSKQIQNDMKTELEDKIKSYGGGFFANMNPTDISCKTEYKNYVLYSTFTAETTYKLTFPIKFIGERDAMSINFNTYETVTITDGSEFVRNTDMAVDYLERSKIVNDLMDNLKKGFEKVKGIFGKFGNKS